jgi:hypothetical protein
VYVESGIPMFVGLNPEKGGVGHAVLLIGHADEKINVPNNSVWTDVYSEDRAFVFIDDNKSPYQFAKFNDPTEYYGNNNIFNGMKFSSLIVPLPKYVYMEANIAMFIAKGTFDSHIVGLPKNNKWITRLLLTNSRSYKSWVSKKDSVSQKDNIINSVFRTMLLRMKFPAFIWVCEIYKA